MAVRSFRVVLLLLVVLVLVSVAEARKSGGGRKGSGGRVGSKNKGSKSKSSSGSKRVGFLGSNTATKAAIAAGVIYGASSWRRRRLYHDNPNRVPTVCYNDQFVRNDQGNVSYLGRFVCPTDGDEDDEQYCCGNEGYQTCCEYFDDGGRIAGLVVGVVIGCVALAVFVFCCCIRKNSKGGQVIRQNFSKRSAPRYDAAAVPLQPQVPYKAPSGGPYPTETTYQPPASYTTQHVQPMAPPPVYNAAVAPPMSYDPCNPAVPPVGFQPPPVGFQTPPASSTCAAPPPTGFESQNTYPAYQQGQGSDMSKPPLPAGDMSGTSYPPGGAPVPYGVQPDATPYSAQPMGFDSPTGAPPYTVQSYPGAPPPTAHSPTGAPSYTVQSNPGAPPPTAHSPTGAPPYTVQSNPGAPPPTAHSPTGAPPHTAQPYPVEPPQMDPYAPQTYPQTAFDPNAPTPYTVQPTAPPQ